jgi:hypothetical protein
VGNPLFAQSTEEKKLPGMCSKRVILPKELLKCVDQFPGESAGKKEKKKKKKKVVGVLKAFLCSYRGNNGGKRRSLDPRVSGCLWKWCR